ncbi:SPOR domain-containing protein [Maribacter algarum]|uniref:SPOR domain-containing protein n=1 Tax=Maribacter algarum (ex Zhang et al. 2020) TaxID=2578118 RepID=A0A5S3PV60_9FLAO|nr:SPOR domain-containing protein [Maribacter algarum]TMM58896.1 SPOR domain-containing protein [Maribacter algarum]
MVLEHYISELLYRYNCVMVPGLGAFLTQMKSAVIHKTTNAFYPPSKAISFNEQVVTNDGLLVSYMAEAEKTSYEEMLTKVTEITSEWKSRLQKGEKLLLDNIGELKLNDSGKIQFQPHYNINYLTSSFGLSSFVSAPVTREILKEEVEAIEEKVPFVFTPEQRKTRSLRPYLKYAAVGLLTISLGLTGYRFMNDNLGNQQLAVEEAQEQVAKRIQAATFFDVEPLELPSISLDVVKTKATISKKTNVKTHHIVAGAFRFRKNADKKIRQLKRRGYNATYIGTNRHGLHMVNYDSYTDVDEALNALRAVKRTQSKDAWLLSVK